MENKDLFIVATTATLTGKGQPLSLRTKMSLDDYKSMLQEQREDHSSVNTSEGSSLKPTITRSETNSAESKVQTISVSQPLIPSLVNPAAEKNHTKQIIAKEVSDDAGHSYLEVPVKEIHFIINGKESTASSLKQFSENGENNLFKVNDNEIDVVPAKNFSGETDPLKLAVTTINGDQHIVDYSTVVLKPVVDYLADLNREQVIFQAGDEQRTLKDVGAVQAFFTKDGDNTTVVNVTANGQTVGEAQIEPETGEIKLVKLMDYSGQLDKVIVTIYLEDHQKIECDYQPKFKDKSSN
ncbi:hypothetical protein [Limosilactobacillus agrestimuris]|uniref:hypothetical protein n=1 Tax=Limosilactobacillus agrestimuris TaxID=2941331 RepID=UPI00203CE061|nr:hypothetical protein [Limosilactobacillus agrestimuris]